MWRKIKNLTLCALLVAMLILLLINSKSVNAGALKGLTICAEIIIPSLFIFSVVGIFLVSSNCLSSFNKFLTPFTKFVFGLSGDLFFVFLASLFSGYPVGAKLIDNSVKNKKIDENAANTMLCYCVNSGPAFIVLAIGEKVFLSKNLGYILLLSHILTALLFAVFLKGKIKNKSTIQKNNEQNLGDTFVSSVSEATSSIIGICAFVVLFSVVSEVLKEYNLTSILPFFEITTGIITSKNLYFTAFLLGFGGISVQLQVLSVIKNFKVNKIKFIASRILHGGISTVITFLIIKILKLTIPVLSNNRTFSSSASSLTLSASVCFICSAVVLVSSLKTKKTAI